MKWLSSDECETNGVYAFRDLERTKFGILYLIDKTWKTKLDTCGSSPQYISIPSFEEDFEFLRIDKIEKKKPYTKSEILSYVFEALDIFDKRFQFGVCHNCDELRFKTTDGGGGVCSVCQNEHIWDLDEKYMDEIASDYEPGDKYLNEILEQKKIWDKVQLAIKKYKKDKKV